MQRWLIFSLYLLSVYLTVDFLSMWWSLCGLKSFFLRAFLCSLRVVVSIHRRCIQFWKVQFLNLFWTHIICQRHLWDVMPYVLCLALYSYGANLLHSLIMWLIVSTLSPHSLHLLSCCVLSILALIWLVLIALSCTAIWRDSVSLLRFSFLSQVQVFRCEMLFIRRLKRP